MSDLIIIKPHSQVKLVFALEALFAIESLGYGASIIVLKHASGLREFKVDVDSDEILKLIERAFQSDV